MSATKAIIAAVAAGFISASGAAAAVPHPQFIRMSVSGHEATVRAADDVHMEGPANRKKTGKKCSRACSKRDRNIPID